MTQKTGSQARAALPLRLLAQRAVFMFLVMMSFGLMLLGKADTIVVERLRAAGADLVAPAMNVLSRPVAAVNRLIERTRDVARVYEENLRLRAENRRLLAWEQAARTLQTENGELRDLMRYRDVRPALPITARVVADTGGVFVHSLLITAGEREGVRKGSAVLSDEGLIGRISTTGWRASRVLLVTDINSKIPVQVENTRVRAILAGDNADRPLLSFLPPDAQVAPGDRIVTSGHGGVFPHGIPVGIVTSVTENGIRVEPFIKRHRMMVVRIADYGLRGILADIDMGVP